MLDGEVDELTGTIKSLMDSRMREDLAARVRRGHRGVATSGRSPSSVAFGYQRTPKLDDRGELVRGLREIDAHEAAIVRRIFEEFAVGRSAMAISQGLNMDGVLPPRRGFWRAGTLLGNAALGTGILRNRLYVGELVYGRTTGVQSPTTRKQIIRPAADPVSVGAVPALRIIDDVLWGAVQLRLEQNTGDRPEKHRRPKHVLSGLGFCGICGGNWIITGNNGKAGARRWGCARAHGKACTNTRLIIGHVYEARVLADLKGQMLAPDVVAAFVREYHLEHARESKKLGRDRDRAERQLSDAGRKLDRLVAALSEGGSSFPQIRAAMTAARDDHDRIKRALASMDALPVLTLHPGLADSYRREMGDLERLLMEPDAHLEAIPQIRSMIDRIELLPKAGKLRGVDLTVHRRIDQVLAVATRRRAVS